jgi:hypothetical protein
MHQNFTKRSPWHSCFNLFLKRNEDRRFNWFSYKNPVKLKNRHNPFYLVALSIAATGGSNDGDVSLCFDLLPEAVRAQQALATPGFRDLALRHVSVASVCTAATRLEFRFRGLLQKRRISRLVAVFLG